MGLLGPRDLSSLVNLTGWDATELSKLKLVDGTSYQEIVGQMNTALAALNGELSDDPLWSSLASYSDAPQLEYNTGSGGTMERFTEYSRGDAERAAIEGHMIPLIPYDKDLGWTWSYLKKARMAQVQADIRNALDSVRNTWRIRTLSRMLKQGDDSGALNGLGAGGLSPGFATAAANTGVDFNPPAYAGVSFDTSHEHYVPIAGGVFTAAVFADAEQELREHGHTPPFDFAIGTSDSAAVSALTGFVGVAQSLVAYGAMQDIAKLPVLAGGKSYYIGTISNFAVRVVPGIPQYYGFGWKSYGANSPMNPLRIRLEPGFAKPTVIAIPDPAGGNGQNPIQKLMLYLEFGVGVNDRTAATARYVNNAAWADGTPS